VNRFLSVGPRDPSGFHPIRTLYEAVDLCDEMEIVPGDRDVVHCDCEVAGENTVAKALRLAREVIEVPPLEITIHKGIPPRSGLGGGSSDAAGLLRVLRRANPDGLSPATVHEIACAVGKDVAFFLVGGRARAEGYGELLTPLEDGDRKWLVIVRPGVGVDTATAFSLMDAGPPLVLGEWDALEARPVNDFERVAPAESLALKQRMLELGATTALLCGSGSAVFGEFEGESQAREACLTLAMGATCWVARTLTRQESLWMS
jgi:4-diphosphocytidyl-2-C-methyl-D-erythritol kinase